MSVDLCRQDLALPTGMKIVNCESLRRIRNSRQLYELGVEAIKSRHERVA